jgi:hypothetical protein
MQFTTWLNVRMLTSFHGKNPIWAIYRYGSGVPRINTGSGRLHVELEYEYGDRVEWAFDTSPQAGAVQPTMTARCETHIALLPHRQLYYETHITLLPHPNYTMRHTSHFLRIANSTMRHTSHFSRIANYTMRHTSHFSRIAKTILCSPRTDTVIPVLQTRAPSFARSPSLSSPLPIVH